MERSHGESYEALAFTFCKTATVVLIAQKFALPVAAGLCAVFYVLAVVNGKRDTRCVGKAPLLIAAFWTVVAAVWLVRFLRT